MKKLYFLLLTTVICLQAIAQSHTVIIYGTGATGSGTTGCTNVAVTTEGTMSVTAAPLPERAWVVFDLSSLPPDAIIVSARVGIDLAAVTGTGTSGNATYGVAGDIHAITPPATLYTTMVSAPAVAISGAAYGAATGHRRLNVNAAGITSLQGGIGGKYSVSFTSTTAGLSYVITGETGLADSSGVHAPFIAIKYKCGSLTGISAVATPATPCDGTPVTLVGTASGADSYQWAFPGGGSSPSNIATHTVAGTGVYTFTATSATGCSVDSMVNVTALPTPSPVITASGSTVICPGYAVILDGTTTGGVSYQWYDAGVAISGATDATYDASTSGDFTVQVINSSACSGTSAGTGVFLVDTPSLTPSGNANLCISSSSSSILLAVNTSGVTSGIDFQWQINGVDIPGATDSSYTATASGAYDAIVSESGGSCTTASDTTHVSISPTPNPIATYSGGLLSTSTAYAAYQWFLNSTAIPGATLDTYVPTTNGSYRVRVTNTTGCSNFSAPVAIGNVGVAQITREMVKVYPNPALSAIKVDAPVSAAVEITSIAGRTMISGKTNDVIDIAQLAPGIYFVVVYDEQGGRVTTEKLVKE